MKLLTGKNAIITGSSRGFGKTIAEEFIKQDANVLICSTNEKTLKSTFDELSKIKTKKQQIYSSYVDVSNYGSVIEIYNYAISVFRTVDILINNAGIEGSIGPIENTDIDDWKKAISTNLFGTVSMCKIFIPHFKQNNKGKIINIAGGGATSGFPFMSSYAVSKTGIVRFSESIAEELKDTNIEVNCISPGPMNTKIFEEMLSAGPIAIGEKKYQQLLKQKEAGGTDPKKGVALVLFLASDKSNGISGKLISALWDNWKSLPKHIDELKESDIYTLRRILPKDKGLKWGDIK